VTYLLAIDTTAGTSVALLNEGLLVTQVENNAGLKHAELIGNAIAEIFTTTGIRPAAIQQVAIGRGPALFTGLRVGIAAGLMFAEAVGAEIIGVVSHDAIALSLYAQDGNLPAHPLLIHTDARRGEVYWALYGGLDEAHLPILLAGPSVGKYEDVVAQLRAEYGEISERTGGATAEWVARLARLQAAAGRSSEDSTALYLRAPDATMPKPNQQFGKRVSG